MGTNTLSQGSGTEYIESNGEFELGDRTTDLSGDLSIRYKATSKFEVYGMFSRTKSAGIEGDPESYLDLDPDHVAEIGMQITDLAGFDVEGVWIHQSRSVLDKNEEGITRAFSSFDLSVGKTFMKRIDVGLDIENVFGIESFESVGLYNSRFPANSFASHTYFENVAQSRRFTISVGINFL